MYTNKNIENICTDTIVGQSVPFKLGSLVEKIIHHL